MSVVDLAPRQGTGLTEAQVAAAFAGIEVFSLGCMLVQPIIDSFFGGVLTMQVISYFTYQRNDKLWTKSVVTAVAFVNLCITVYIWASDLVSSLGYWSLQCGKYFSAYLFVQNFGRFSPFAETGKLAWFPLLDSINSSIVQSFFAYRAYRLCNNNLTIPMIIMALILTSFGATVAVRVIFASLANLFEADKVKIPELIWLSSIMCADIIITVCILYGLWQSRTGWTHTDKTISKLIRMTLESQVPPTIVAITFMAEFVRTPASLFGSTLQGIQPKFYAMGLLYALNARVRFQQQEVGDASGAHGQVFAMSNRLPATQIQVDVETETYVQQGPYGNTLFDGKKEPDSLSEATVEGGKSGAFNSQARLTSPEIVVPL